ncbi:hypothetical protein H7K32_26725, partial [Brevibacillus agri]|uniref:beta strand repeat-containing protein n=1 Tax=Brevibacillus agri TaxID=51101 RepID=UPI001C8EEDA8
LIVVAKDAAGNEATASKVVTLELLPVIDAVSAITAKSLELKFNTEVDTTKVTFTVTRDGNPVVLTPKFADDKKSVTLASDTSLLSGTYVVKAAGVTFAEGKDSASTVVAAEKVAKIEFVSDKLVRVAGQTDKATVAYKVFNQYNEDITNSTLAQKLTWTASVATDVNIDDDNAGKVTIDKTGDFADAETVVITVIDAASGVTKSGTFTVAAAATVQELALGDVTLPTGKTRVEIGLPNAAEVAVTAKDQYGVDITTSSALTAATTIVTSDPNVTATFEDVNNKPVLRLNTSSLTTAKTVTVTVVVKATGTPVTKSFDVVTAPGISEVTVTAPATSVVAGDAAGKFVAAVSAKDQFGGSLTPADIAAAYAANKLTITSSNATVIASDDLAIDTTPSSENYGKLVNTAAIAGAGSTTITVTVNATGKSSSFTVTTQAARAISSIAIPATLSSNLIAGASTQFALEYKDQYGAAFDATGDIPGYKVNLSVTKVSGDDNGLSVSPSGDQTNESSLDSANAITLTAAAGKVGTYNVVAKLINTTTNEVVSQATKTVNVVANSSAGITYSVDDIPTLYKSGADFGTENVVDATDIEKGYAKEVKITATDANGNSYVIPSSEILSVTSDSANLLVAQVSGKYYVAADATLTADATANLSVVINTKEGVRTITKPVTISKDALVATEIKLLDKAITNTAAKTVTSLTIADRTEFEAGKDVYAYVVDQFGGIGLVYTDTVSQKVANASGITITAGDSVEIASNKLKLIDADDSTTAIPGATLRYVAMTNNGKTATIEVKVTDGLGVAAPSTADIAVATEAGKTQLINVDDTMEYKVGANGTWTAVASSATTVDNIAVNIGDKIYVRVKATNTAAAGASHEITVEDVDIKPAAAPNVTADDTNNVLVGADATMEYRTNGGEN